MRVLDDSLHVAVKAVRVTLELPMFFIKKRALWPPSVQQGAGEPGSRTNCFTRKLVKLDTTILLWLAFGISPVEVRVSGV